MGITDNRPWPFGRALQKGLAPMRWIQCEFEMMRWLGVGVRDGAERIPCKAETV